MKRGGHATRGSNEDRHHSGRHRGTRRWSRCLRRVSAKPGAHQLAAPASSRPATQQAPAQASAKTSAAAKMTAANGGDEQVLQRRDRGSGRQRLRGCVPGLFQQRRSQQGRHSSLTTEVSPRPQTQPVVAVLPEVPGAGKRDRRRLRARNPRRVQRLSSTQSDTSPAWVIRRPPLPCWWPRRAGKLPLPALVSRQPRVPRARQRPRRCPWLLACTPRLGPACRLPAPGAGGLGHRIGDLGRRQ